MQASYNNIGIHFSDKKNFKKRTVICPGIIKQLKTVINRRSFDSAKRNHDSYRSDTNCAASDM